MHHGVDLPGGEGQVNEIGNPAHAQLHQVRQGAADDGKGHHEHQGHEPQKTGQGGVFSGEHPVNGHAALVLPALMGPDHGFSAQGFQEPEAHICHGGLPVQAGVLLHNGNQLGKGLLLLTAEGHLFLYQGVLLHQLGGGEPHRHSHAPDVRFQQHGGRMDAPVHRAYGVTGIIAFQAKVKALGLLLRPGNKQGVINELVNALVPGGGDGNDGDAQNVLQLIDAHGAAVGADLVHHVEGQHHGNLQLHQLHGQVQVPFNVGGVHNIDDAVGPLVHEKVPGDDFLVGVGGQGVDARQVRDRGLRVAADGAVLPVYGDTGEIAHVLIGAGELVKEGGFAAVLVAGQGKGQRALLQGQVMAASVFAHAGVGDGRNPGLLSVNRKGVCVYVFNFNPPGLFQPQGQFIAPQRDLHRVSHGGNLLEHDLRLGGQPHVQQMVPQGAVAAHRPDECGLAGLQFVHCHTKHLTKGITR